MNNCVHGFICHPFSSWKKFAKFIVVVLLAAIYADAAAVVNDRCRANFGGFLVQSQSNLLVNGKDSLEKKNKLCTRDVVGSPQQPAKMHFMQPQNIQEHWVSHQFTSLKVDVGKC